MKKTLFLIVLLQLFIIASLFAVNLKEIDNALSAVKDCVSASIIAAYSEPSIELHNQCIIQDENTSLPVRISYFLADPCDFMTSFSQAKGNVLTRILSNLFQPKEKRNIVNTSSAVSYAIDEERYKPSDYLLNGNISFSLENGTSTEEFIKGLTEGSVISKQVEIDMDCTIVGTKLSEPLNLRGHLFIFYDSENRLIFIPLNPILINGEAYKLQASPI